MNLQITTMSFLGIRKEKYKRKHIRKRKRNIIWSNQPYQRRIQNCCNIQDGALCDNILRLPAVNYYHRALHRGCFSSPRSASAYGRSAKIILVNISYACCTEIFQQTTNSVNKNTMKISYSRMSDSKAKQRPQQQNTLRKTIKKPENMQLPQKRKMPYEW